MKTLRFLHDLAPNYLEKIASVSTFRDFRKGDVVFEEGNEAGTLYLIVSGSISLKTGTKTSGYKQIVTLAPGDLLGWSSLTTHPKFAATATADAPTRVIQIDGTQVRKFCDTDAKFGYEIMSRALLALSKRLIATWTQLAEVYLPHYAPVPVGASAQNE
jgi:CRP-like cAMP-binding protein